MKKDATLLRNQKGFTLIEIIAVLIILGILAAVAVPKFMDMQEDAQKKALEGAVAEGLSTASMAYGKLFLQNGSEPTMAEIVTYANNNKPASDDFSYTFSTDNTYILVTVGGKANTAFAGASDATKSWKKP